MEVFSGCHGSGFWSSRRSFPVQEEVSWLALIPQRSWYMVKAVQSVCLLWHVWCSDRPSLWMIDTIETSLFFFRQIDTNQIVSAASRSLSVVGCLLITGTFPELCNLHHHSRKRVNDVDPRMADFSWLKNISIKKSHWMLDLKVLGANMLWRSYIGGMPD